MFFLFICIQIEGVANSYQDMIQMHKSYISYALRHLKAQLSVTRQLYALAFTNTHIIRLSAVHVPLGELTTQRSGIRNVDPTKAGRMT
jgi:hypothetical protein